MTAVSRTLEFQKPNTVCRIASGVGEGVFTIVDVAKLAGVTSGECRITENRIRGGEYEVARQEPPDVRPIVLGEAINSR